jgi:hypothetical protein
MATFSYDDTTSQNDLIAQVEVHADKVTPDTQSVGINREAVYDHLVTSMRNIFNAAPRHAIDKASADGSGQTISNINEYSEIELPDDFSRFLSLRLDSWMRELYELVDPRSNQVRLQYNTYTSADGYNPVATKVADPTGASGEKVRAWPQASSTPTITEFTYLAETAPENAPEILKEAIILQATSYTLAADGEEGWDVMRQASNIILRQVEAGQQPMVQQALRRAQEMQDE